MVILTAIIYWLLICASLHCDVYYLIFQTVIFIYITGEHHLLSLINNVSSGLQLQSITKSITNVEAPIKEKYGRNIILGTHKEGGAVTFWSHAVSLPLSSNAILSWKFCHVVHKLLRDGHPNGNLHDRYGHIVALYAKLLCIKIDFHLKVSLMFPSLTYERDGSVCIINMSFFLNAVFRQMECSSTSSTTPVGQCRLAPLVLVIQDCGLLYHFLVKLLFKLHSRESCCLHAFRSCFWSVFVLHSLTQFFERARGMEFFKSIIQIPDLPDEPPNFLRAASLADHVKPMVVQNETFPDYDETDTQLDFGEGNYQMVKTTWIGQALETEADTLRKELEVVKPELELIKVEAQRAVVQLKSQVNKLESELEDQRTHKQMALVENERLRMEVENLRAQTAVAASIQATVEDTAQIHFTRLKEKHAELVSRHADLMRKNAEMVKQLSSTQQAQEELLTYKQQMAVEVEQLRQDNSSKLEAQRAEIERLKQELATERDEMFQFSRLATECIKTGKYCNLSSVLVGLQAEKETLLRTVKDQEAEIASLRQAAQLHQTTLQQERDRHQREMTALQNQLQEKVSVRKTRDLLLQKLQDEQFSLLQCAVVEAEGMVLDAVAKVDDPLHVRCISTPDYLINRAELTLASIDKMQQSHVVYLRNMDDASGLLRSVTQFSHLISDTIVNGAGTAHSAPTDQADRLTDNCRDCATHCLQYLKELKLKATLPRADPTAVRYVVQRILNQGQDLLPRGADVRKEELAEMVDKEMAATSTAIEDAVLRMDEILSQARRDSSGVKLEVNQSIIGSCSDLMKAIHMLVTSATDLQRDIVESGRGAGSVKDFYAKNSCWTEGLISASKAVGWGATQMLESADKVVTDRGKYEELIVCSHEIAASTAQLVAASKVKADRGNRKLQTLQQASRHVNDMAAVVVSSTKSGQMQIENKNSMDFSSMSLIKLKTEEMDSQVKVLELEKQLANERIRLGGLRKKHYEIEGISTDSPPESAVNSFDSSLPTVFPDPSLSPGCMKKKPSDNNEHYSEAQHVFILLS
uniref:Huntingtin interacting protein 1 related n=1 Tax=Cyprinus carpio TaxID=7962 RepID=A0A8C1WKS1_CYPCA